MIAGLERGTDVGLRHAVAEMDPHLEGRLGLERRSLRHAVRFHVSPRGKCG